MKYFVSDDNYIVVLEKGELLLECLRDFVGQTGIRTAWIQGLGASIELEIGYYNLEARAYHWQQFNGAYEITSLQGNVVRDDENIPLFHVHGTFADTECKTYGGHINRLVVGGTCEIFVQPTAARLTRKTDENTGLRLLCDGPV